MNVSTEARMSEGSNRLPPKNIGMNTKTFFSHCQGRISFMILLLIICHFNVITEKRRHLPTVREPTTAR